MSKLVFFVALLLLFFLPIAPAPGFKSRGQDCSKCHQLSKDEARTLLKEIIPNLTVLKVSEGPVKGFWEVYLATGGRKMIIYVDFLKKHFLSGGLISITDRKNLTQERLTELNRVDVSQIPLESALIMGDPKAKIKIIAFDDPD